MVSGRRGVMDDLELWFLPTGWICNLRRVNPKNLKMSFTRCLKNKLKEINVVYQIHCFVDSPQARKTRFAPLYE
jgi:hypothetical protein